MPKNLFFAIWGQGDPSDVFAIWDQGALGSFMGAGVMVGLGIFHGSGGDGGISSLVLGPQSMLSFEWVGNSGAGNLAAAGLMILVVLIVLSVLMVWMALLCTCIVCAISTLTAHSSGQKLLGFEKALAKNVGEVLAFGAQFGKNV